VLFVVDTSCLIVLQKLGWLDELRQPDDTFLCPTKVIHELKNNKTLLKWINKGIVGVVKVEKPISITAISTTDAEVISLALERGAGILSEDKELGKKAERLGISVYNLASLFMLFYQYGRIDQRGCLKRLRTLADEKFISQTLYRQLLMSIKS